MTPASASPSLNSRMNTRIGTQWARRVRSTSGSRKAARSHWAGAWGPAPLVEAAGSGVAQTAAMAGSNSRAIPE